MRDDDGRDDDVPTGKPPADTDSEREKQRRHFRDEKKLKSVPSRLGLDLVERLMHEADRKDIKIGTLIRKVLIDHVIDLDHADDKDGA